MRTNFLLSIVIVLSVMLFSNNTLAQSSRVVGQIIDANSGEELIGATVQVKSDATTGTVTDVSGRYQLEVEPGIYTLLVSYISYASQTIEGVQVQSGSITPLDIALKEEDTQLEEVVVTAAAIRDNDIAMLKIQKNALAVQDGISSKEMTQLGVANAAESMKQITGASIEGGKYVVMRGLGDRYSITQLNGITMPSADPYKNSTSMDLIPADMIDNVVTVKTFTPDQPGNFTGGKVDITIKSLPDEFYMNVGVATSYNTQSSLINDFITDGTNGSYDDFGFDDGTRKRPSVLVENSKFIDFGSASNTAVQGRSPENMTERQIIDETAKSLDNPFVESIESTPLNYALDFSVGNQYDLFGKKFGANLGVNYSQDYTFYKDGRRGLYSDGGGDDLITEQNFSNSTGTRTAQLGGLLTLAYQLSPNHEITFSDLYNHNTDIVANRSEGLWLNTAQPNFVTRAISFTERSLNNAQLKGQHYFENFNKTKLDWVFGYVNAQQNEPDTRIFGFITDKPIAEEPTQYLLQQSEVGILPSHYYRDLTDQQYNTKVDLSVPLSEEKSHELKVGFSYSNKQRAFNEYIYSQVQVPPVGNPNYTSFSQAKGDLDKFFSVDNAGVVDTPESNGSGSRYGFGNFYSNQSVIGNSYIGEEIITAFYLMGVYEITTNLKLVGGARLESTKLNTESKDENKPKGDINTNDILPALNVIYKIHENSNFRMAASQTLARPNIREIAPFASVGGVGFPIVLGNADLERTLVQNYDLRYEVYPLPGDLFAVSVYYKNFQNPIVYQLTPKASTPEIQPINVDKATVYGAEVEFRKSFDFISEALANFRISTNVSYIFSKVDKSEAELTALRNADRPNIEESRPFQGQSPYIINIALLHHSDRLQWDNSLSFNIFGRRLSFITDALDPDVYEQPRPSLNFTSSKRIGESLSIGFKATNLFNMKYLQQYDFGSDDFVYDSYTLGRSFSLSLSYGI